MPVDEIRTLMAIALAGLLLLLRLDAPRFGSAEYDVDLANNSMGSRLTRLAWPGLAVALVAAIAILLPAGRGAIGLGSASVSSPLTVGLAILGAAVGVGAVVGVARLRSPEWPPRLNPGADAPRFALDSLATAIVDELTFRGVLLGFMLVAGAPPAVAFCVQLLLYGLETRLGRSVVTLDLLLAALLLGALTGMLALATGGVVAPFVAHAATRFAALDVADAIPPQSQNWLR
ncbi:MAG: type II CAAX prenyl endopeptidase Rce1 family protein [Candidatus Limnocylindrales bacterium]